MAARRGPGEGRARGHADIEILGGGDHVAHWPSHPVDRTGDHLDARSGGLDGLGNLRADETPVARVHHFVGRGQVGPQLEAFENALGVALGHLLVNDAAASGHPLHVARRDYTAVAQAVAVFDVAAQDVGDGLDPAMGMPGESLEEVLGLVRAKVVEKKKRIAEVRVAESDRPSQMNACPLDGCAAPDYLANTPVFSHECPPFPNFAGHLARREGSVAHAAAGTIRTVPRSRGQSRRYLLRRRLALRHWATRWLYLRTLPRPCCRWR